MSQDLSTVADGDHQTKVLEITELYDKYNDIVGAVDQLDILTSRNPGKRPIRRGSHLAIEHWLLLIRLINCYLLAYLSDFDSRRPTNFKSQAGLKGHARLQDWVLVRELNVSILATI